jgi:hypothetical protein
VIGGVIGRVDAPQVLILGRYDEYGQLQVAGRTTDLSPPRRWHSAPFFAGIPGRGTPGR